MPLSKRYASDGGPSPLPDAGGRCIMTLRLSNQEGPC